MQIDILKCQNCWKSNSLAYLKRKSGNSFYYISTMIILAITVFFLYLIMNSFQRICCSMSFNCIHVRKALKITEYDKMSVCQAQILSEAFRVFFQFFGESDTQCRSAHRCVLIKRKIQYRFQTKKENFSNKIFIQKNLLPKK